MSATFSCACIPLVLWWSSKVSCPSFNQIICLLVIGLYEFFTYSENQELVIYVYNKYNISVCLFPFNFSMFLSNRQFFFILTKSNLSVVSFTAVFSMFYLRDLCLPQGHEDFLPLFLPKFIVLAVMSRSVPSTSASLTTLQPLGMWTTQTIENSQRDGNTRPPYLPPEIPVCWSRSNI